jgi:hypothetical protein
MTRPTRRADSSLLQFRKRVPADIQKAAYGRSAVVSFPAGGAGEPAVVVQATLRQHVFPTDARPGHCEETHGLATAQLERLYSAIRNGPRALTHKEVVAIAGLLYEGFASGGEDNPGRASTWNRHCPQPSRCRRAVRALSPPDRRQGGSPPGLHGVTLRRACGSPAGRQGHRHGCRQSESADGRTPAILSSGSGEAPA